MLQSEKNKFLSYRGYGICKSSLNETQLDKLRSDLTLIPYTSVHNSAGSQNDSKRIYLYLESPKKIYIPKVYGLEQFGIADENNIPPGEKINLEFKGQLRSDQMEPVNAFMKAAHNPYKNGGIIQLGCGAGKTVIGLYIISLLKCKTLIVVHKDFLLSQWKERIEAFLPGAKVGLIKAKIIDVDAKDIVIASLQSLSMKEYNIEIFKGIGLVIFDEVHRTGTEVFSQALKKNQFYYTLGLSATVTRKDGMSKVFKWYLGDVVYKKRRKTGEVYVHYEVIDNEERTYCREEVIYGKLNIAKMINNITTFYPRTKTIVDMIVKLIDNHKLTCQRRKFLVLSDRKLHLKTIASMLPNDISFGYYIGNMKQADLQQSEQKDVILATFSFASEGFDAKDLDTLILATPKSDIEQSVGRILRKNENERVNIPLVVDIVDNFSIFARQAEKRLSFYNKYNMREISIHN